MRIRKAVLAVVAGITMVVLGANAVGGTTGPTTLGYGQAAHVTTTVVSTAAVNTTALNTTVGHARAD